MQLPRARLYPAPRPETRAELLDPLGDPAAVGLARKHDPHALLGPHGHEVSAILLDTRPVVHQHELERVPVERRPLSPERPPRRLVQQLPVPTPVLSPGLLEHLVGPSHITREILPGEPPPRRGIAEHE